MPLPPPLPPANLANGLKEALSAHRVGQVDLAEQHYRNILAGDPRHADALHLLGLVLEHRGRFHEAEQYVRRALAVREEPAFLCTLGDLLRHTGRPEGAEASYRRATGVDSQNPHAYNKLGNLYRELGRPGDAEAAYRQAIEIYPASSKYHNNLGVLLREVGRRDEAEQAYQRALAINPSYAQAWNNLANLLLASERLQEAETAYRKAIELKADYVQAHANLGVLLMQAGRIREAEEALRCGLSFNPSHAEAWNSLAELLRVNGRAAEAEAAYQRTLQLDPQNAAAYNNLGIVLAHAWRVPEAEAAYQSALRLLPGYGEALANLGALYQVTNRRKLAEPIFRQALKANPPAVPPRMNLASLLLATGRLEEGWPLYEARLEPGNPEARQGTPKLPFPQWAGELLAGKSLIVWPEQGFGDSIQMARYGPALKALGLRRLTYVCQPSLRGLLRTAVGFDEVVTHGDQFPDHDYWAFAWSLPLRLSTRLDTIPARLPYLHAEPDRVAQWKPRLPGIGFKVGLVWKGAKDHRNDVNRSLPSLATLSPLWEVPGVSFVSLQKRQGEEEALSPPPGQPLLPLGQDMKDFADSAAIVAGLDLVICVDTSMAHLAGALGKPVWVLLPAWGTDWRWLQEREDSPWYPGAMRLFRQKTPGDWTATVADVARALQARAHGTH